MNRRSVRLSILLTFCLALLLTVPALATEERPPLLVAGVNIFDAENRTVNWDTAGVSNGKAELVYKEEDPERFTLILTDFHFEHPEGSSPGGDGVISFAGYGDLTIELNGENVIAQDEWDRAGIVYYCYGETGALTINGTGSLTVTGGSGQSWNYGVYSNRTLAVDGVTLTAAGGDTTRSFSCGIYSKGNCTLTGATVTALGGETPRASAPRERPPWRRSFFCLREGLGERGLREK